MSVLEILMSPHSKMDAYLIAFSVKISADNILTYFFLFFFFFF